MGMLDRYKKKGGFAQLLQLLETSPSAKREQFLNLISGENSVWEDALRKRILTINKVYSWDGQYLVEVFSRVQPLTLANALHGNPADQTEKLLSCLPPISRRKITDLMAESNPSAAEKNTCVAKILSEVRGFISQGILKLEKIDPDLLVPEDIEETLNNYVPLNFDGFTNLNKEAKSAGSNEADVGNNVSQSDVDFLKRKIGHLTAEITALKNENAMLKDKLSQIKRIA